MKTEPQEESLSRIQPKDEDNDKVFLTIMRRRGRLIVGSLVIPAVLAGCGTREQASAPVSSPPAAPSVAPTTTTTTTTVPSPPPVWKAARWGMTTNEVLAAFPGEAQRLAKPAAFVPRGEESTDVAIPAHEADGMTFQVLFGFESNALNRVHLSAVKAGVTTCSDLEKLLTEKHSAPSDRTVTQTTLRGEQIVWKRPEETITLACAEAPSLGYRTVTLDYTASTIR